MPWSLGIVRCTRIFPGAEGATSGGSVCLSLSPDQVVWFRSIELLACLQFNLEERSFSCMHFGSQEGYLGEVKLEL